MRRYAESDAESEVALTEAPTLRSNLDLAETFKALGDPHRIALLQILADGQEHCVCNLAEKLQMAEYQVSRHLAPLRRLGLVVARRQGTWMHYHACAEACTPFRNVLAGLLSPQPKIFLNADPNSTQCCTL